MNGFMGKVLVVNLSEGTTYEEKIDPKVYDMMLSGIGLGVYYLYKNIPQGADALGEENILGFLSGALTGTGALISGRWMVVCKSPLTGGWGDSNCGGTLAPMIKQSGYDAIFFRGISEEPVYLYVDNRGAQIRSAAHLWGKDAVESEELLHTECTTGKIPSIATIGQAAENLSLISGISNDRGRYAARSGVGAVMGSKRLKAVVLAGSRMVKCADRDRMRVISKKYARKIKLMSPPAILKGFMMPAMGHVMGKAKNSSVLDGMMVAMLLRKYGSIMTNTMSVVNGDSPLKNWKGSKKDYKHKYYKNINPDKIIARETQKYHCVSCAIGCGGICSMKGIANNKYTHTHKPEYETVCGFGGLMMNRDLESIFYANELCNRGGLDTISAAGTIAFAIECYEQGILTKDDFGGLEMQWGNAKSIIALLEMMIHRQGIGDILADGSKIAAQKIGKGSKAYAVHAGGQEAPMHDAKVDTMLGTTYSADPTPGRHTTAGSMYYTFSSLWEYVSWAPKVTVAPTSEEYVPSEKEALKNVAMTCYKMVLDTAGGCYYGMLLGVQHNKLFETLNVALGRDSSPDEYMQIGKRVQTMREMFCIREGVDMNTYRMHGRMSGEEPLTTGPNKGITLDMDGFIKYYRRMWGWSEASGVPYRDTIDSLDIGALFEESELVYE